MRFLATMIAMSAAAFALTGCDCFCDWDPCDWKCEPCCQEERCYEVKGKNCCPQPHFWDRQCCDPSNYEL